MKKLTLLLNSSVLKEENQLCAYELEKRKITDVCNCYKNMLKQSQIY